MNDYLVRRQDVLDTFILWIKEMGCSEKEKDLLNAVMYDVCQLPTAKCESEESSEQ